MRGHTIIELMVTTAIFSIFLLALTAIFSTGLKSWNLVQNKIETQQESSICINFLMKDLRLTDDSTSAIGGKGYEYAVLQSAMNDKGVVEYDLYTGEPKWQSYILYYTLPRNGFDVKMAMDPNEHKNTRKRLIRKVIKHTPFTKTKLAGFELYFNEPDALPLVGEEYMGKPRVLSTHIYEIDLENNPDNKYAIDINIVISKSILENRLAFEKNFSDTAGQETMLIKNTVLLKNTNQ
jgi:prepilin-type N-terminal cleavage/methylation domain-containing protein